MNNVEKAQQLLADLQVPYSQQTELCALTLLAMASIPPKGNWSEATNHWFRIHDLLLYIGKEYKKTYAENSRETFRKQAIHHFRTAAFIEDNGKATNSPNYRYRITSEFLSVMQTYNGPQSTAAFLANHQSLMDIEVWLADMPDHMIHLNGNKFLGPR